MWKSWAPIPQHATVLEDTTFKQLSLTPWGSRVGSNLTQLQSLWWENVDTEKTKDTRGGHLKRGYLTAKEGGLGETNPPNFHVIRPALWTENQRNG